MKFEEKHRPETLDDIIFVDAYVERIVKETAREFDLPYHEFKTFASAFKSHYNHLKALGKKPMPVEI